jgi:hypothetical protein
MSEGEGRTFVSRWSRRKVAARRGEPEAEAPQQALAPVTAAAANAAPAEEKPAAALPDPETLKGLESEYGEFLKPGVDESLRRTALKRLFADPHFNVMDGLDVYIDDYSKPDPIPPAFLRAMNQARGLRLFEDEEKEQAIDASDAAPRDGAAAGSAEAEVLASSDPSESLTGCPGETEEAGSPLRDETKSRSSG